jgi:hypothetical protein
MSYLTATLMNTKVFWNYDYVLTVADVSEELAASSSFFFFFHWHYRPLWALACRTRSFHFFLSVTNSLHHR